MTRSLPITMSNHFGHIAILLSLGMFMVPPQPESFLEPIPALIDLAERYCLDPDGDQQLTWALADHDGYSAFDRSEFPGLRTPGARQVRGFAKTFTTTDIRILTAVNRFAHGPNRAGPAANFHLCWVSARPASRARIDSDLNEYLGVRRYRQEGAFAYPWTLGPDNKRQSVARSDFSDRLVEMGRDHGMRIVTTNEAEGWVSIGYMRPVDSCADWCY